MENDFENKFEGGPWRSARVSEVPDVLLIGLHDSEVRLPDRQARALSTLFDEVDGAVTAQQLIEKLQMHDQTAVVALSKASTDADVTAILQKQKGAVPLVPLLASDCKEILETKMTDSDEISRGRRTIPDVARHRGSASSAA